MHVKFADGSVEQYENEPLAAGAEGEIFRSCNGKYVVKLYKPDPTKDGERINRIDTLINDLNPTKDPYWIEFFTWPEKRVVQPRIGFRMRFVQGMKTLDHYIFGKSYNRLKPEERGWFIGRIATAIKLVSAANRLSSMGLCYPDFSHKNMMVEPFEGKMALIDCDSLIVPGRLSATVMGTTWYRAPEIVMGTVTTPSVRTDRHALAVILYFWLLTWHPLIGDKVFDPDPEKNDELRLGQQALYIEHPVDKSNRATGQKVTSSMLGPELEKMFKRAFIEGLHNPNARPFAYEWQEALRHTYDRIIPCASPHCDWRFFVATPSPRLTCPKCEQPLGNPQTLPFMYLLRHKGTRNPDEYNIDVTNAHYIVGWPGRMVYQWHIRPDGTPIYTDSSHVPDTTPRAVFEYDQSAKQWYLKNLALPDMLFRTANDASGSWRPCPPNSSIPFTAGLLIQFGSAPEHFRARVNIVKVT